MKEAEIEERFRLLQQEVTLAGEAVDTLKRDYRAEIDAVRLEMRVIQHCLLMLHPELQARLSEIRAELIHKVDPEAP